jgi:hypothetical protein
MIMHTEGEIYVPIIGPPALRDRSRYCPAPNASTRFQRRTSGCCIVLPLFATQSAHSFLHLVLDFDELFDRVFDSFDELFSARIGLVN